MQAHVYLAEQGLVCLQLVDGIAEEKREKIEKPIRPAMS